MTIAELTNKVRFLTDAAGNRQAAVLDLAVWEEVLAELRWDELFSRAESHRLLEQLADAALEEHHQGKTKELIPEKL